MSLSIVFWNNKNHWHVKHFSLEPCLALFRLAYTETQVHNRDALHILSSAKVFFWGSHITMHFVIEEKKCVTALKRLQMLIDLSGEVIT